VIDNRVSTRGLLVYLLAILDYRRTSEISLAQMLPQCAASDSHSRRHVRERVARYLYTRRPSDARNGATAAAHTLRVRKVEMQHIVSGMSSSSLSAT